MTVDEKLRAYYRMDPCPPCRQYKPDRATQVRPVRQPERTISLRRRGGHQRLRRYHTVSEREC
jgi:hypothetical protein